MSTKQVILRAFVLMAVATAVTVAAHADPLDVTLTGQNTDITFSLPSSPTVSWYSNPDGSFQLDNVVMEVNGYPVTSDLDFYRSSAGGGLASNLFDLFGAQLFTGGLSDPTFETGDFTLTSDFDSYNDCNQGNDNLSITDASAVSSEPESLLLLATGMLGLLGAGAVKRYAAKLA